MQVIDIDSSFTGASGRYAGPPEPPPPRHVPLPTPAWQSVTTIPQQKPGKIYNVTYFILHCTWQ